MFCCWELLKNCMCQNIMKNLEDKLNFLYQDSGHTFTESTLTYDQNPVDSITIHPERKKYLKFL